MIQPGGRVTKPGVVGADKADRSAAPVFAGRFVADQEWWWPVIA